MPVKGTRQAAIVELDYVTNNASSVRLRATLALLLRVTGEVSIVPRTSELTVGYIRLFILMAITCSECRDRRKPAPCPYAEADMCIEQLGTHLMDV